HWTYNEYDLKKLDDPDERFCERDDVFSVAGNDFEENSPAAYQLLENISIEQEDTQEIMSDIEGGMDEEEAAQKFLDENEDLKEEWLEGLEKHLSNTNVLCISRLAFLMRSHKISDNITYDSYSTAKKY